MTRGSKLLEQIKAQCDKQTVSEFLELMTQVKRVREAQKAYFKTRDRSWMMQSKELESMLDTWFKEEKPKQDELL